MNPKKFDLVKGVAACAGTVVFAATALGSPIRGRAIIASMVGEAEFASEMHAGALEEGMALTQGHRLQTAPKAAICSVLTPGALLCINEETDLTFKSLRHMPRGGLPGADRPVQREVELVLNSGAILIYAGDAVEGRTIEVTLPGDVVVRTTRGRLVLAAEPDQRRILMEAGQAEVIRKGERLSLEAGELLTFPGAGPGSAGQPQRDQNVEEGDLPYDFHVCRSLFPALAPVTFDWEWGNMGRINERVEPAGGIIFVGGPRDWQDVSPSVRRGNESNYRTPVAPPAGAGLPGQWRRPDVWDWYRNVGTVRGVNYIPRTAVNAIEMWQADTFDPETIAQELAWADDVDLNSVRVFLPYAVWTDDAAGFKDRIDRFLGLAADEGLSTVLVLFDDRRAEGMIARTGAQPEPVPGVHNSRWTPSPGRELVPQAAGEWPGLERYVRDIVGAFAGDRRVLMWDLYNEPGADGTGRAGLPLLFAAFDWVRDERPDQPVTAGVGHELSLEDRRAIMKRSDVITLGDFSGGDSMRAVLGMASTQGRPLICTGWLRRRAGSVFGEVLPAFAEFRAGWYHWGLVKGRSQMHLPWEGGTGNETMWEQDLLEPDGTPHDEEEIRLIRGFSFESL